MLSGGEDPKPYVAGTYFMVPKPVAGDELTVVADFMKFVTNTENQVDLVTTLKRLPGNAEAFGDAVVTGDPLLSSAAEAAAKGIGQPVQAEMRCVFDAMTPGVRSLLGEGNSDVVGIAATMQSSAETCIAQL